MSTYLNGALDYILLSCHVHVSEWIYTPQCLNVKELLVRNKRDIWSLRDSNGIWTHNHLARKRTLNLLAKLFGCRFQSRYCHLKHLRWSFFFDKVAGLYRTPLDDCFWRLLKKEVELFKLNTSKTKYLINALLKNIWISWISWISSIQFGSI